MRVVGLWIGLRLFGRLTALGLLGAFLGWGIPLPQLAAGQNVTLGWHANTEPELAGYRLYYGLASGSYSTSIDAGDQTTITVTNLQVGLTYYFVVTAYADGFTRESGPSNEVAYTVPNTAPQAADDFMTAAADATTRFTPSLFLRNDIDPDGDFLTLTAVSAISQQNGSVALAEGLVFYTAPAGYLGQDSFQYTVSDGHGGSSSATVWLTVEEPTKPARRASTVTALPDGSALVEFQGMAGVTYNVEASTDLTTWVAIGTASGRSDGQVEFSDLQASSYPSRFYRITAP